MGTYKGQYGVEQWITHISIHHRPTETQFYQQGGRIIVLKLNPDTGLYHSFSDFTTEALQVEHTVLTEPALRKAAVTWLKDHNL